MSQEIVRKITTAVHSCIKSCGNITIINHASSSNNTNINNAQFNVIINLSDSIIEDVVPALTEKEFNCLPLASESLYLEFLSDVQIIPNLSVSDY